MKLTVAAILVSRGMKVLQAAPAAYPYRSAAGRSGMTMTDEPHNPFWELRTSLLSAPALEAASMVAPGTSVWGVLMETGYPQGPVTLLVIGDGTSSLYLPTGGGVIGAGAHATVRAAATALLITADVMKTVLTPAKNTEFPDVGWVRFFVLTLNGVLTAEGAEQAVGNGTGPLSAIFHAGQAVISQIRIASDQSRKGA